MMPTTAGRWALAASCVAALWGCGSDPSAGGSSVETEDIRAQVTLSDGSPAAGAAVLLRPASYLARAPGGEVVTESVRDGVCGPDGEVVFPGVARGEYVLEARTATGSAAERVGGGRGSRARLVGSDTATLEGFVPASGGPAWVAVRGLERGVWTDDSGRFRIARLPAGSWEAVAAGSRTPTAWGTVRMGSQNPSRIVLLDSARWKTLAGPSGLVLDDFETDADRPSIGDLPRHLFWYYSSDSTEGGATVSDPRLPHVGLARAVVAGSGPDGSKAVHVRFTLDPGRESPWAQIGLTSSEGGVFLDFSGLDSLEVQVKGSGRFRIDLPSRDVALAHPGCHDAWGVEVDLPADWKRIVIRRKDLALPTGGCATGSTLEGALQGVDEIRWKALTSVELGLDDLRIHGVEANQF